MFRVLFWKRKKRLNFRFSLKKNRITHRIEQTQTRLFGFVARETPFVLLRSGEDDD